MSRSFFVEPDTERLQLFGGEAWIEVKKELTFGEEQRLAGTAIGKMSVGKGSDEGAEVGLNWERHALERLNIYITEWSFTDAKGKRVDKSRDAVANLAPKVAAEITRALDAYLEAAEGKEPAATETS